MSSFQDYEPENPKARTVGRNIGFKVTVATKVIRAGATDAKEQD